MATSLSLALVISVVNRASAEIRTVTGNFAALKTAGERAEKALKLAHRASEAAEGIGRFAEKGFEPLREAVDVAMKFESAMTRVAIATGTSGEELDRLAEAAKATGLATRFTGTETAQAYEYLAKTLAPEQILAAMPAITTLASATGSELGTATQVTARILEGFNFTVEETTRVSDVLTSTVNHSNVPLETLGETMRYVSRTASDLGVSFEEVAGLSGLLGVLGIQGEAAGGALRSMMQRLVGSRSQGKALL